MGKSTISMVIVNSFLWMLTGKLLKTWAMFPNASASAGEVGEGTSVGTGISFTPDFLMVWWIPTFENYLSYLNKSSNHPDMRLAKRKYEADWNKSNRWDLIKHLWIFTNHNEVWPMQQALGSYSMTHKTVGAAPSASADANTSIECEDLPNFHILGIRRKIYVWSSNSGTDYIDYMLVSVKIESFQTEMVRNMTKKKAIEPHTHGSNSRGREFVTVCVFVFSSFDPKSDWWKHIQFIFYGLDLPRHIVKLGRIKFPQFKIPTKTNVPAPR